MSGRPLPVPGADLVYVKQDVLRLCALYCENKSKVTVFVVHPLAGLPIATLRESLTHEGEQEVAQHGRIEILISAQSSLLSRQQPIYYPYSRILQKKMRRDDYPHQTEVMW